MNVNRDLVLGEKVFSQVGVGELVKIAPTIISEYDCSDYEAEIYTVRLDDGKEFDVESVWHRERLLWEIEDRKDQVRRFETALLRISSQ